MVDDTMVVSYQRTPCHWGPDLEKTNQDSGIRMVTTSSDGGLSWSKPIDVLTSGRWDKSPFKGVGGGLGVHEGIVYLAIKDGIYRLFDKGKSWTLISAQPIFLRKPEPLWAPGIRITFDNTHGLILWTTSGFSQDANERKDKGAYGTPLVGLYSKDMGKFWNYKAQILPEG
jgi:hypothetical protein